MTSVSRLLHEVRENFTMSDFAAKQQTQGEHAKLETDVLNHWVKTLRRARFKGIEIEHNPRVGQAVAGVFATNPRGFQIAFYYVPSEADFPVQTVANGMKTDVDTGSYETIESAADETRRMGVRWFRENDPHGDQW